MATKKLSLLLVAFLTCASEPALTQGGGGGGGVLVAVQAVALPLAVQVVVLPLAVQVVVQRARGTPAPRVVKQDLRAQRPAPRVVKQDLRAQRPATRAVK